MTPQEELVALRRMAELEDKARFSSNTGPQQHTQSYSQLENPYSPKPKEIIGADEFLVNSAKQAGAGLLGTLGAIGTMGRENVGGQVEKDWGVRKDVTTDNPMVKFGGRALEWGLQGLPFAPIAPAAFLPGTALIAGGDMAGEAMYGDGGRFPGAIAGGLTPPSLAYKAGKETINAVGKGIQYARNPEKFAQKTDEMLTKADPALTAYANTRAADTIRSSFNANPRSEQLVNEVNQYLDRIEELTGKRPEVTLGEALDDVNLKGIERTVAKSEPAKMAAAETRYNTNAQILEDARLKAVGDTSDQPILDAVIADANRRTKKIQSSIDETTGKLTDRMSGITRKDLSIEGARIRNIVDIGRRDMSAKQGTLATELTAKYGDAKFDVTDVFNKIDELAKELPPRLDQKEMPRILQNIQSLKDKFGVGGTKGRVITTPTWTSKPIGGVPHQSYQANLNDTWDMLKQLGEDIGDLSANKNASPSVIRKLREVEDAITDKALRSPIDDLGKEGADALENFRFGYKADYIQRFRQGANLESKLRSYDGTLSLNNERVIHNFLKSDTDMQSLMASVGDNPVAMNVFDDAVISLYAKRLMPNGQMPSMAGHNRFMESYEHLKKYRPELYNRLLKEGPDINDLNRQITNLTKDMKAIESDTLLKLSSDGRGVQMVKDAMKNPGMMNNLTSKLSVPEKGNLRNIVMDMAMGDNPNPDDVIKFITSKENEKSLRILFGKDYGKEMRDIVSISAVWKLLDNPKSFGGVNASALTETKWAESMRKWGVSHLQLMSAVRAMGRNFGSGDYFAAAFGGQMLNKRVQDKMIGQISDIQRLIMKDPKTREAVLNELLKGNKNMKLDTGAWGMIKATLNKAGAVGTQRAGIVGMGYQGGSE